MSIKDKIGLPFSLTFLDAEDVLAAVGFPYCTCIFTTKGREAEHHVCFDTDVVSVPFPPKVVLQCHPEVLCRGRCLQGLAREGVVSSLADSALPAPGDL